MKFIKQILCDWFGWFCPEPIKYVWVWVCREDPSKLVGQYCANGFERKFELGKEPKITHDCPPPEKEVDIVFCKETDKVATGLCYDTEARKIKENLVPTLKSCRVHVVPKTFPKSSKRRMVGSHIFLSFLREAYDPATRGLALWRLYEVLIQFRKRGVYWVDYFMWVCTGKGEHSHLNDKIPWRKIEGLVDFNAWDNNYFDVHRAFLKALLDCQLHPRAQIEMFRYANWPYENNRNGVTGFLKEDSLPTHYSLCDKVLSQVKDVFGDDYKPDVKWVNEPAHHRNHKKFHLIGDFHVKVWENSIKFHTELENFHLDLSGCEAAGGEFDKREPCQFCGRMMGNDDYTDANGRRRVMPEYHCFSIKEDFSEERFQPFIGSAWKKALWSGDGSQHPECKGLAIPGTKFKHGDTQQTYEMSKYVHTKSLKARKKKESIICIFMFGLFRKDDLTWNKWTENCNIHTVKEDLDRLDALAKGEEDVYV